jgi:outer membrane immunogenic protein
MRKQLLAGAALLAAFASSALAADLPVSGPAPVPAYTKVPPPIFYGWNTCYIGVEGGGNWGKSNHIAGLPAPAGPISAGYTVSGGLVGGEIGCNYQVTSWVFGIEGDLSWTNKKGGANEIPPFTPADSIATQEHWLATARGRLGYIPTDRILLYATGGFADASVEATINSVVLGRTFTDTENRIGWTIGGGIEGALWDSWTWKVEYLYVRFASETYFSPPPAVTVATRSDVPLTNNVIRAGLNWRFGWGGTPISRY